MTAGIGDGEVGVDGLIAVGANVTEGARQDFLQIDFVGEDDLAWDQSDGGQ